MDTEQDDILTKFLKKVLKIKHTRKTPFRQLIVIVSALSMQEDIRAANFQ
jgi:hypothetical protein